MLKTFFKTGFRSIKRNFSFSLINISGLAIGLSAALVIYLIVQHEMTYDNFFVSPLIAPAVAIAAETPQMDTALEIIMVSSSSILSFLQIQNAKYQTLTTTTSACSRPSPPALRMSEKITPVPNSTSPIFTNNSSTNPLKTPLAPFRCYLF